MPVHLNQVRPSIVVDVDEPTTPRDVFVVHADPRRQRDIGKSAVPVVVIQVAGVVYEVGLEDVEPTVAIVVGHGYTHACLLVAVLVVGAPRHHSDVGKRAIVVVLEQDARL